MATVTTLIGTQIQQHDMSAQEALDSGLLTSDQRAGWFAEWAAADPTERVYMYTFGGFIGGFIYRDAADFTTLDEFAQCAEVQAEQVWQELLDIDC